MDECCRWFKISWLHWLQWSHADICYFRICPLCLIYALNSIVLIPVLEIQWTNLILLRFSTYIFHRWNWVSSKDQDYSTGNDYLWRQMPSWKTSLFPSFPEMLLISTMLFVFTQLKTAIPAMSLHNLCNPSLLAVRAVQEIGKILAVITFYQQWNHWCLYY